MKNCKKNCGSMSALKLALIITGSIVAAAGVVALILSLCKKKHHVKNHVCDCCDAPESSDSWDIDEDALGELELDDDCCCDECGAHDAEEDGEVADSEEKDAE